MVDVKSQKPLFYQINANIKACAECYKSPKEYRPYKSVCSSCGMLLCMACEDMKKHQCYVDPVFLQLQNIDGHLSEMKEKSTSYSQKWQEMERKLAEIENQFVIPTDADELTQSLQRTYQEKLDQVNETLLSLQSEFDEKQKELEAQYRKKAEDVQRRMHDLDMKEKLMEEEYQKKRKEVEEEKEKVKADQKKVNTNVNAPKPPVGVIRKANPIVKKPGTAKSPLGKRS